MLILGIVLHVGNITQIRITIGEGFVSKIHCHFMLPVTFCLVHSRWCSSRNSFMLTKISLKVISDTVNTYVSFISLGIFLKLYNVAFCASHKLKLVKQNVD